MKDPAQNSAAKALGKNIVRLRKLKGFSQSEFCYEADIDISTLSRLERGNLNVTFSTLFKISKLLGVSIKDLFDHDV